MNECQIQEDREKLKNAGTPADRDQLRAQLRARAENSLAVIHRHMGVIASEFRRQLAMWRTEAVREDITPFVLRDQIRSACLYFGGACCALAAEMSLAGWIFYRLQVVWWYGSLAAFLMAGIIGAGIHFLADDPDRPKNTQFMVKRYAARPAFKLLLLAILLVILARYVYGWAVLFLLPVFGAALWVGTFTLMVFSAALFTNTYLLVWSLRDTKKFESLDEESGMTAAFLEELNSTQPPPAPMPLRPVSPSASSDGPRPVLRDVKVPPHSIILFLALTLSLAVGCFTASSHADTSIFGSTGLAVSKDTPEVELVLSF